MLALLVLTAIATILGGVIGGLGGGIHSLISGGGYFVPVSALAHTVAIACTVTLGLCFAVTWWAWIGAAVAAYFLSAKLGAYINYRKNGF